MVICNSPTAHYPSGLDLLKAYDFNGDGLVSKDEAQLAVDDWKLRDILTKDEADFVVNVYLNDGLTSTTCPESAMSMSTVGVGLALVVGAAYAMKKKKKGR